MALPHPASVVAQHLPVHGMPHEEVMQRIMHSAQVQKVLGALLQQPQISQADVAQLLNQAVARGMLQPSEARQIYASLPADPGQLRMVLQHLLEISTHAHAALKSEMGARLYGVPPGGSRPMEMG